MFVSLGCSGNITRIMRKTLKIFFVFTVCEKQVYWNSVLTRFIDDLLALDSIVCFGFSGQRLELTATFSQMTPCPYPLIMSLVGPAGDPIIVQPVLFLINWLNLDDPNITMEEYIRLEEEKARKRGKVFNWETAKYDIRYSLKDKNEAKIDKTEHRNGKSMKSRSRIR
ncbi:hypothetical protein Tco_1127328, partial [Tanacetum coccineum]